MKKIISILLSALIILSCMAVPAFASDDALSFAIVTDVHHNSVDSSNIVTSDTAENPFGHVVSNGKMTVESAAITDAFLEDLKTKDIEYLVITGDISDDGTAPQASAIVSKLEAFENESGISVIASMGNHESYGMTSAEFKEYYKNLGYDKAISVDPDSASYTADLDSKYRIICIDTNGFNNSRLKWIEKQAEAAKKDGKNLISVTHFTLFSHYTIQQIAHDSVLDTSYNLPDKFIEWGIKFNFSGHTHEMDVASYTNDKGIVYDTVSGSLTTYPANYKTAVFTDKEVRIKTEYISSIDTSLLPGGLSEEALSLIKSDFRAYAKRMFIEGSRKQIAEFATTSYVMNLAKISKTSDPEIAAMLETVVPRLRDAIYMPLYGENSLSQYARKNKFRIPAGEYTDLLGAGVQLYCEHCQGNEDCSVDTTLGQICTNGLGAALEYALEPLTAAEIKTLLTWAAAKFELPVDISDAMLNAAANFIDREKTIEFIATYAISPIIDDFARDKGPDDIDATLPGYEYNEAGTVSFFAKIKEYFRAFLLMLSALFSIVKRPK